MRWVWLVVTDAAEISKGEEIDEFVVFESIRTPEMKT